MSRPRSVRRPRLRCCPPGSSPTLRRSRSTTMRCDTRTTSFISDEMNSTAMPLAREPQDLVHDLLLGRDVDAARRLVEDQQARLGREPAREHAPSAGCRPTAGRSAFRRSAVLMPSACDEALGQRGLLGARQRCAARPAAPAAPARCSRAPTARPRCRRSCAPRGTARGRASPHRPGSRSSTRGAVDAQARRVGLRPGRTAAAPARCGPSPAARPGPPPRPRARCRSIGCSCPRWPRPSACSTAGAASSMAGSCAWPRGLRRELAPHHRGDQRLRAQLARRAIRRPSCRCAAP